MKGSQTGNMSISAFIFPKPQTLNPNKQLALQLCPIIWQRYIWSRHICNKKFGKIYKKPFPSTQFMHFECILTLDCEQKERPHISPKSISHYCSLKNLPDTNNHCFYLPVYWPLSSMIQRFKVLGLWWFCQPRKNLLPAALINSSARLSCHFPAWELHIA
jgi:hypothetical protein